MSDLITDLLTREILKLKRDGSFWAEEALPPVQAALDNYRSVLAERDRLKAKLAEAKEIIELYKAMKEGVEIRLFDLQDERGRLQQQLKGIGKALSGEKYKVSTGIDDSATFGYGDLDDSGFWEIPVPEPLVKVVRNKKKVEEERDKLRAAINEALVHINTIIKSKYGESVVVPASLKVVLPILEKAVEDTPNA